MSPRAGPREASASVAQQELVGLRVRVVGSGDPGLRGREGLVVDETQGTLTIEVDPPPGAPAPARGREVVVPKAGQAFAFTLPDGSTQRVEGRDLAFRPEDRIRRARPRRARS